MNLYTIGDLYTRGDYDKVIKKIDETEMLGNCFELYEYYVKSHIMANKELNISNGNSIRNQLICAMYSAYVKQKDVEQAHFIITSSTFPPIKLMQMLELSSKKCNKLLY